MIWVAIVAAGIGMASGIAGWIAAWRSRGESNAAKDATMQALQQARVSELAADIAKRRSLDAEAMLVSVQVELEVSVAQVLGLSKSLSRATLDREALLEQLAKLGAPVGDVIFDGIARRLYADRDRQVAAGNNPGAGSGADSDGVPALSPTAPTGTDTDR